MSRSIHQVVRELCLWMTEAEEYRSHGAPNFRVRGKTYASYAINHHGDGRIALWLNAAPGVQQWRVDEAPEHYFVPPYVGPRGWLGVHLDRGLEWAEIAARVREAYERVAPPALLRTLTATPNIEAPSHGLDPAEFQPLSTPPAQSLLQALRTICLALPDTSEAKSFGNPIWRAGKKTFASFYAADQRLRLAFWVGIEMQAMLTTDPRFQVPPYMGHNGWIALDLTDGQNLDEIGAFLGQSHDHYRSVRRRSKTTGTAPD